MTLDEAARALYEAGDMKHAPSWDQLGDVTRSVWIGRAAKAQRETEAIAASTNDNRALEQKGT